MTTIIRPQCCLVNFPSALTYRGLSPSERIPTGRLRRAAKTTGALAPGSLRLATSIATSVGRDPDKAAQLLARRHEELADEVVDVLSSLRGGAMKIGQLASFI